MNQIENENENEDENEAKNVVGKIIPSKRKGAKTQCYKAGHAATESSADFNLPYRHKCPVIGRCEFDFIQ